MPLRAFHSNHVEALVPPLARAVHEAQRRDPFEPVRIIVPSRAIEAFLKVRIAEAIGVTANVSFEPLRRALEAGVVRADRGVSILDASHLEVLLLAALDDADVLRRPALAPVRHYLGAPTEGDARERRRFQLARELARVFFEYAASRRDLLRDWRRGKLRYEGPDGETERWQREVWLDLFDERGVARRTNGGTWMLLPEALETLSAAELARVGALHVFGVSYAPPAYLEALARIGAASDVTVYALNPCHEFWEDVAGERRVAVSADLDVPGDTPALRFWGRPGREHVRLLNEITECDFEPCFVDPGEESLLHRLQHDVLVRAPERTAPERPVARDDRSVSIVACPSIEREVEIVAAEIWSLVRESESKGDGLRFHEIAVLVGDRDRDRYLAQIEATFGGHPEIPYTVLDVALSSESSLVGAALLLLELPLGSFGREEMLRLLVHPAVIGRFPDASPDEWTGWASSTSILFGVDAGDLAGTYVARDLYHWDQGLRRVALGAFLAGARSGDDRPYVANGGEWLPEEIPQGAHASAAAFVRTARALLHDATSCRAARMPLAAWSRLLARLLTTHLAAVDEDDEHAVARAVDAIRALAERDVTGVPIPYRVAFELASDAIASLDGGKAQHLGAGVAVSSFLPMRAVPFRVSFVLGMGEGQFPSPERKNPLDLRNAERRRGDVSSSERDRYLFLETLLSTRERLVLSYVARDATSGDALRPSTVVQELAYVLRRGYVPEDHPAAREVVHPLRRSDRAYFPDLGDDAPANGNATGLVSYSLGAREEAAAAALGRDLRARVAAPPEHVAGVRPLVDDETWAELARRLGVPSLPDRPASASPATIDLPIAALRAFLECPLQGSAKYLLRFREDEEDPFEATGEALEGEPLVVVPMLRGAFFATVGDEARVAAELAARRRLLELRGALPTGVLGDVEAARHVGQIAAWRRNLDVLGVRMRSAWAPLRIGRAREHEPVTELLPPVTVDATLATRDGLRQVRVRLHGATEALSPKRDASIRLVTRRPDRIAERDFLPGFLSIAVLAAGGVALPRQHRVVVNPSEEATDRKRLVRVYRTMAPLEARGYLGEIVGDLLSGPHPMRFPIEAATKLAQKKVATAAAAVAEVERGSSSDFGPIAHPERFAPPDDAAAREILTRRYAPFFTFAEGA